MAFETIKKYVGVAGEALVNAWGIYTSPEGPEAQPPVGSQNLYPGGPRPAPGAGAILGIPIGTIMVIGIAYFLLKK